MASSAFKKLDRPVDGEYSDDSSENEGKTRTSADVRRRDQDTLTAQEEAEGLLTGSSRARDDATNGQQSPASQRGRSRRTGGGRSGRNAIKNASTALYDTEEGGPRSSTGSSGNSSEVDLMKWRGKHADQKKRKASRLGSFSAIHVVIVIAFLALLYGAYRASQGSETRPRSPQTAKMRSNGTHLFAPTTLLVSLDGFRADFLQRNITPALSSFIRQGVSPKYMLPSFPSLTFPNHFTLVTGFNPESHGIVGNTFFDPAVGLEFHYGYPERSMQPGWWNAEPIWLTAELAGLRTAIHMWPGSEAHIGSLEPTYIDKFKQHEKLSTKVETILGWLDLPGPADESFDEQRPRPQFIAAYVPNVDADGHKFGPNSTQIRSTIRSADTMLASIFQGVEERNLTDIVNIVVVSDHGMATTSTKRLIQYEDLVDPALIEHIDGWPLYGLRPKDNSTANVQKLYEELVAKSKKDEYHHAFDVYLRDENMPPRYHFSNNARIAPLWIVPQAGWAIVQKHEFDVVQGAKNNDVYHPRGLHGYDFEHPLMRAIFAARGPAFPHPQGAEVRPFRNIEVYNMLCDSLGIEPVKGNGTLHLPLQVMGQHDFDAEGEVPADPPVLDGGASPFLGPNVDAAALADVPMVTPAADTTSAVKKPVIHDEPAADEDEDQDMDTTITRWWGWLREKVDDLKGWATTLAGKQDEQATKEEGKNSS